MAIILSVKLEPFYNDFINHTADLTYFLSSTIGRILCAVQFMTIGMYLHKCVCVMNSKVPLVIVIILGFLLITDGAGIALINEGIVDLHFGFLRNSIITFSSNICCIAGLLMVLMNIGEYRVFSWIGRNTLSIMGLQIGTGYTAIAVSKIIERLKIQIGIEVSFIICVLIFGLFTIIGTQIINKYFTWILRSGKIRDKE